MQRIAIYGAGGQGREVAQLIRAINRVHPQWEFVGWYDDGVEAGTVMAGYPVLGDMAALNAVSEPLAITVAIGWSATKQKVVERIQNPHISFPVLVHPSVIWESGEVQLGEGTVLQAGVICTTNVQVGRHVLVNLGCTLAHDCKIGDYVGLMPSVNISGEVTVGDTAYIGTGAQVLQQLNIGARAVIGAGSVVHKHIPAGYTAVGVPARAIRKQ